MKKRRQYTIPFQYLPPRCLRMMQRGDLTREHGYAAAMFVYHYRTQFLIHAPPTNFVKSERVDTSHNARGPTIMAALHVPPDVAATLIAALIEERAFKSLAPAGSRSYRHHQGKALFRQALTAFLNIIDPGR